MVIIKNLPLKVSIETISTSMVIPNEGVKMAKKLKSNYKEAMRRFLKLGENFKHL